YVTKEDSRMLLRASTRISLCSAVVVAMVAFSIAPASAFTLSSPSLERSFPDSQIEKTYYYYHRYYHPYYHRLLSSLLSPILSSLLPSILSSISSSLLSLLLIRRPGFDRWPSRIPSARWNYKGRGPMTCLAWASEIDIPRAKL